MDLQIAVIRIVVEIGLIAVWGFWEYRERNIRHKKTILDLRNGIEPEFGTQPNWGKVAATAVTAVLLAVAIAGGFIFVSRIGPQYSRTVLLYLIELMPLAVLLIMMAVRDVNKLRKG